MKAVIAHKDLRPRLEKKRAVLDEGIERTTLSFYKYVSIDGPTDMRIRLLEGLHGLGCLGRIYVAMEGINAQMNVPKKNWERFDAFIRSIDEFADVPFRIAIEEGSMPSFYKLTVNVKQKIVADGLDDSSFDVTKIGEYLTAKEMNTYIEDPEAIVVDMRNGYESEVGHFEKAIIPDVDTFREELEVAPKLLNVHKNKKIALYCTGGIRCEKASAWLRHNGFKNVKHLRGGIIDYKRQVDEEGLPNRFHGKNFVFDERLGERVSGEVIAYCHLCAKEKCDEHMHCRYQACHVLFICCRKCLEKKKGYCSYKCMVLDAFPTKLKKVLSRNNYKKRLPQFKKNRLRISD